MANSSLVTQTPLPGGQSKIGDPDDVCDGVLEEPTDMKVTSKNLALAWQRLVAPSQFTTMFSQGRMALRQSILVQMLRLNDDANPQISVSFSTLFGQIYSDEKSRAGQALKNGIASLRR